jgi:hypothetical protein
VSGGGLSGGKPLEWRGGGTSQRASSDVAALIAAARTDGGATQRQINASRAVGSAGGHVGDAAGASRESELSG